MASTPAAVGLLDFGQRLLDAVLSEVPDAGVGRRRDGRGGMPLAHCHERDGGGIPPHPFARPGDALPHALQACRHVMLEGRRTHAGQPERVMRRS